MDLLRCLSDPRKHRAGECNLGLAEGDHARVVIDVGDAVDKHRKDADVLSVRAAMAEPEILILSHADRDHIGGFPRFASTVADSCRPPREVWVPRSWGDVALAAATLQRSSEWWLPGEFGDRPGLTNAGQVGVAVRTIDLERLRNDLAARLEDAHGRDVLGRLVEAIQEQAKAHGRGPMGGRTAATEAAQQSASIIEVLQHAESWDAVVRFFDVQKAKTSRNVPAESEGLVGVVTVINALELGTSDAEQDQWWWPTPMEPDTPGSMDNSPYFAAWSSADAAVERMATALTVANRESLVSLVWSCSDDNSPAALVWADSDGVTCRGSKTPWDRVVVATAPHHASEGTKHDIIWDERPDNGMLVICSGNQPGNAPRRDFLQVAYNRRACTSCRLHCGEHRTGDVEVALTTSASCGQPLASPSRHCPATLPK